MADQISTDEQIDQMARKIRNQLRRFPASGIFEGEADPEYRSLWQEFCHDQQEGPNELLESAFEQTIFPFCVQTAAQCTDEQIGLLWFSTMGYFNHLAEEEPDLGQQRDDVTREVWSRLVSLANDEELTPPSG
jgi:hypothetical protein